LHSILMPVNSDDESKLYSGFMNSGLVKIGYESVRDRRILSIFPEGWLMRLFEGPRI
jgi:hypothetical protein